MNYGTCCVKLAIKVIPSSSSDCIVGWLEDTLKIKVKAPADKGKANKAVVSVIEKSLLLQKGSVSIESGLTASKKIIAITGYDATDIAARLSALIDKNI